MPLSTQNSPHCFTAFKTSIADHSLPERFTFPFYYQPHPLSLIAADELQSYLMAQPYWLSNNQSSGKMFGVLVVKNKNNDIGYLTAFSGKTTEHTLLEKFVPPVFDMAITTQDPSFLSEQLLINNINAQIEILVSDPQLQILEIALARAIKHFEDVLENQKSTMAQAKATRKTIRGTQEMILTAEAFEKLTAKLSQQSIEDKLEIRDIKIACQAKVDTAQQKLAKLSDEIIHLKALRKTMSAALQNRIFQQYRFLNIAGIEKDLVDIFKNTPRIIPPAGSGDCAAPKLLQYAFQWGLQPLVMAEFWWGAAPKSEIRQQGNFYGACLGKCQPILTHMLDGMTLDENPLLTNPAEGKSLDIIYQDDDMLVINKPAEFLSVPGKNIEDSVYSRMKALFPQAHSPFIVHRLDMSTSGLMVIALTKRAHKNLQKQFINRTIKKSYIALIDGDLTQDKGIINLPLRGDINDRPRQRVCQQQGKPAETSWQVLERRVNGTQISTKVELFPVTGRTHQLRVHCAHPLGLNMPIIGDDLYGKKSDRLHLHAQKLILNHPINKDLLEFNVDAEF
jgi:tRNA pseudouridine32 synthase/23S rRNA pseudouridine746 synthase